MAPTAEQVVGVGHETLVKKLLPPLNGLGTLCTDHRVPFQCIDIAVWLLGPP